MTRFDTETDGAYYTRPMSPARADLVDANELAQHAAALERAYPVESLARLLEAGAASGTQLVLKVRFAIFDGRVAVTGVLSGEVTLTCQRCLQPVTLTIDEPLRAVLVAQEDEVSLVPESHEAVVAEAGRLDLRWFAEEQALLALPMVPAHQSGDECAGLERTGASAAQRQTPFANLRDLLRRS